VPFCRVKTKHCILQDAVNVAAVELVEDLRAHCESFQTPEGEEALSCLLHDCVGVCGR
jgi:hypothetical protein